jgi:crotonobetainyl-CoA:carnitine CoA-transferase CaiB-like acyl-CoA transferase
MSEREQKVALRGVRVIDFSTHAVGPFATQILAGLGATVIKVERGRGDPERFTEWTMFLACNRGKHSLVLDLQEADDRELAKRLIADATVLVEGYRPGVAGRLGIGFDDARQLQPRIVYVSLPGWGSDGPYSGQRGYDVQFRAIAGDAFLNRESNGKPRPHTGGAPVFDYATAMYAVIGILSALRDGPAEAVHLEVPILSAGLAWNFPRLIDDSRTAAHTQFEYAYRCADGRWLCVSAPTNEQFAALCEVIGRLDLLLRNDLDTFQNRRANAAELNALTADVLSRRPAAEWHREFDLRDVPCMPILEGREVFDDPQVKHLGVIHGGDRPFATLPIKGLPQRVLVDPPEVDSAARRVRHVGWAGLQVAEAETLR